eukprot:GILJ01009302.1.p1 GENE.GILJ01009302.1~~GILJ01009302.1.p1  ORF type:complete len:654 (+),score=74.30 GILJ01009302.1:83-2044(+)
MPHSSWFPELCNGPVEPEAEGTSLDALSQHMYLYTLCLEDVVAIGLPGCLLILFCVVRIIYLLRHSAYMLPNPKPFIFVLKLFVMLSLSSFPLGILISQAVQLGGIQNVPPITIAYHVVEACAWLFCLSVIWLEHKRAKVTSSVLHCWWLLSFVAASTKFVTRIKLAHDTHLGISLLLAVHGANYLFYVIMFVLALCTTSDHTFAFLPTGGSSIDALDPTDTKQQDSSSFKQNDEVRTYAWIVTLLMFTGQLVYGLAVLILPLHSRDEGSRSGTNLGVVFGSYAVAILFFSPIFAAVSERFGRRQVMLWGCLGLSVSTLLFAVAESMPLLILSRVMQGVASAANFTPGLSLLAECTPPDRLGQVLGSVTGWSGMGLLIGPPLGGLLYQLGGYAAPFLFGAAFALLGLISVFFWLPNKPPKPNQFKTMDLWRGELPVIAGVIAIGAGSLTMLEPIIPMYVAAKWHCSPATLGFIFGSAVLAFGAFSPLSGYLSDLIGRRPIIIVGMIFLGLSLPLLALPDSLVLMGGALMLVGISSALTMVPTLPELADTVNQLGGGSYESVYATFNAAYSVGNIAGPVLGGLAIDHLSFGPALLLVGALIIAFTVLMLLVRPLLKRACDKSSKSMAEQRWRSEAHSSAEAHPFMGYLGVMKGD